MTQHNQIDEYLETIYHLTERHQPDLAAMAEHEPDLDREVLAQMERQGLLRIDEQRLVLTEVGFQHAEQVIRRHRLAERLLTDVLHMSSAEVERAACEFEHVLAEEITESICTLLGHPRTCPHGSPIPEGPCCRAAATQCQAAVVPLLELPVGTWARVAYVSSTSDERQHRLTHFGVVPGNRIKLHQIKPSIVIVVEQARLAMEQAIARDIYVWRGWRPGQEAEPPPRESGLLRRLLGGWGRPT